MATKNVFFKEVLALWDSKPMLSAADRAVKNALNKYGAYARKVAKNLIKTKAYTLHSAEGSPPFGHNGITRYKDWIFFAYDQSDKRVFIGAIRLSRASDPPVPEILEHGGYTMHSVPWSELPNLSHKAKRPKRKKYQAARPHMSVAHRAAGKKLPVFFRDSIKPF